MNGWILYKNPIEESWETNRLVKEFTKQDIEIRVVNPNDVDIFVDRDDRKSIIVGGKPRALPDFVIPRTGSGTTYFIKAIIRHLERLGVTLINGSNAIDTVKDKLYTQQILGQSNLPVPKTLLVKHPIDIEFVETTLDDDWKTVGGGTFDSSKMNDVLSSAYKDDSNPNGNLAAEMGVNPNDPAMGFLKKDYRAVMKAIDKKQGKV